MASTKILVTGAAGFIGYHLVRCLIDRGDEVVGLDNINDYYDVGLKYGRLAESGIRQRQISEGMPVKSYKFPNYRFIKQDLIDLDFLGGLFKTEKFDKVCNLAAQAGVRYSVENPHAYTRSNLVGFVNLIEACRRHAIKHLVYASSSSVYGLNQSMPFTVHSDSDHPASLYGATKKSNELIAHSYSFLYGLPCTGLRFFTVYGPWGRPDMACYIFTKAILADQPIKVFNCGDMKRDFTYIDDIVEGIVRVLDQPPLDNEGNAKSDLRPSLQRTPHRIYNIGNGSPVKLMDFIEAIEGALGKKAIKDMMPMQPGDLQATWADTSDLFNDFGYRPSTEFRHGVKKFIEWYQSYNKIRVQNE